LFNNINDGKVVLRLCILAKIFTLLKYAVFHG